jgi:hypothetical protein
VSLLDWIAAQLSIGSKQVIAPTINACTVCIKAKTMVPTYDVVTVDPTARKRNEPVRTTILKSSNRAVRPTIENDCGLAADLRFLRSMQPRTRRF